MSGVIPTTIGSPFIMKELSDNFGEVEVATPQVQPWIWASVFGLVAIFLA